jgi:predicted anti-sigma-YlaC factor YlaD
MADDHVACIEFVELVTDYLEGTLSAEKVALIEEHLDLCEPCRVYLEQIELTAQLLPTAVVDEPIPDPTRDKLLTIFRSWQSDG